MASGDQAATIAEWAEARADDVVGFVQELVRAGKPSASDGAPPVEAAQRLVSAKAESLGFDVETRFVEPQRLRERDGFVDAGIDHADRPYLVARLPGCEGCRSLLLNGHIDVVPAGDDSHWSWPPYSGELVNGLIHGRGSVDAKGPFAALLFGVACAKAVAGETLGDLTVVSVADEESGGMCTLDSLVQGNCADAVVIGEPTEVAIAPAARGATGFRLTVHGRQAHSGAAFEGVNAISKSLAYVAAIEQLQARLDRERPNDLYVGVPVAHAFNIGSIEGGGFLGVVPDTCLVGGVAPAIGEETVADARAALISAIDEVTATDPWLTEHPPVLEWVPPSFEPSYTPGDHEFVQVARQAVARALDATPVIRPLLGGSDLRFYSRHFGIPGIHIGPGALRLGHGANEALRITELIAATQAVAAIAIDWTGGKRP